MIIDIFLILLWTLMLYFLHRFAHAVPVLRDWHSAHHAQVDENATGWNWKNLFLWIDNKESTLDQWAIEIVPTFVFAWLTGAWYIALFYYVWAAFLQEWVEHNPNIDLPILTSGKYHLCHHNDQTRNFCVFIPAWDYLFDTYAYHKKSGK